MVEKSGVEESGLKSSGLKWLGLESSGLNGLGLKSCCWLWAELSGVENSVVEMSSNRRTIITSEIQNTHLIFRNLRDLLVFN